jgi:minor histocompatibility antigen H13
MANPGPISQIVGRIAYEFAQVQYLIPTYLHIILAALFPIYTAAHASLSRPASAAKPIKSKKSSKNKDDDESDDDDEDKPRMEGLSPTDAILFPLTAGVALTALYFLIKWDKALLNKILNLYMSLAGLFGVIKFLSDTKHIIHAFVFPSYYTTGSRTWHVNQAERKVYNLAKDGDLNPQKTSPLPWIMSQIPLPLAVSSRLWAIRSLPQHKLTFKFYIHRVVAIQTHFNIFHFLSLIEGVALVAYFTFISKPWYLTNLMGFAFSYTALQLISPTTFATGSLVLVGLFFYDIYMVFFTYVNDL